MKKKILILIIVLLLIGSAFSLAIPSVRNTFIDRMNPKILKADDCYYTDGDIESAVECVKEHYKAKEWPVILLRISFSDEKSRKVLNGYHRAETTDKENIIVLYGDYLVLKDFAAYSSGIFTDCCAILVRENADSPWEYVDGGYA